MRLVDLFQTADLIPFLGFAYQGFGEGIDADAFAETGIPCLIATRSRNRSTYILSAQGR